MPVLMKGMLCIVGDDTDEDNHIIPQVLVACDQSVPTVVLKADARCCTIVETIEIFHRCDDRIGGIVREYLHSHR